MNTLIQIVMYAAAALMLFCGASLTQQPGQGCPEPAWSRSYRSLVLDGWETALRGETRRHSDHALGTVPATAMALRRSPLSLYSSLPAGLRPVRTAHARRRCPGRFGRNASVAYFPAVNGWLSFFRPTGRSLPPSPLTAPGTTRIGSYVLNHSFIRPGIPQP